MTVLVLLPPSEGKAVARRRGRPLDLATLSLPTLTATRQHVLTALVELCSGDPEVARATLDLSPGLADEVVRNGRLLTTPAMPASEMYTGVLYDALGLDTLDPAARRLAGRSLLLFSGLWGALRPGDRVPPYRLSGGASLPGLGTVSALWRAPLAEAMDAELARPAGRRLVLDLRSSTYAPFWRPDAVTARRTVTVRVLQERVPGDPSSRTIVSHFNKATKGRLVRAMLETGADPRTPGQLVDVARGLGFGAELGAPASGGRPHAVDIVVAEL